MTNDEIVAWIERMERESKALKEECIKVSWYMRGGIPYDSAMMLSPEERKIIMALIKENMEVTKKSGLPFF